jgi:hypothetical protein
MLPDVLCCAGVFSHSFFQMPVREVNVDGWMIPVDRSPRCVNFASVPVQSCDLMAVNGVVHSIDKFAPVAIARYVPSGDGGASLQNLWEIIFSK